MYQQKLASAREVLRDHHIDFGRLTIGPRPSVHRETYNSSELRPYTGWAGSMDALKYPSRVGNQLRYPDDGNVPARTDAKPPRKT